MAVNIKREAVTGLICLASPRTQRKPASFGACFGKVQRIMRLLVWDSQAAQDSEVMSKKLRYKKKLLRRYVDVLRSMRVSSHHLRA